jgi:BirA family biotin operon repressor/biotin-[acetyl-CoA-carboxylase] ligase
MSAESRGRLSAKPCEGKINKGRLAGDAGFVYPAHPLRKMFTPTILRFESIDSTNLEAMRQAKAGAAEGLCIIGREQTRGRGRLDRSWHSPKDAGLYFSIVLRPSFEISRLPLISLVAALAVFDALAKTCLVKVDIKWPNDICFEQRKLAGILSETVETADGTALVLGIGINLTSENFPSELSELATSIASVTNRPFDREALIAALIESLTRRYEMLYSDDGCQQTIRDWSSHSSYAYDCQVRVALHDQSFEGVTRGLEPDGALRVETSKGAVKIVRAGDVTALRAAKALILINDR